MIYQKKKETNGNLNAIVSSVISKKLELDSLKKELHGLRLEMDSLEKTFNRMENSHRSKMK